ncbi:MAG TPA: Rieske 2Fe-2S domain-containing protein [Polyangia bacterium]|nr:Rieske 2Fe-2S domain-containing protein [Polyangia bacterium]
MIRVAEISELPPGKGKVVELGDRRLTIYNLDGKLVATATRARLPPRERETHECPQHGLAFDAFAEDSPARLRADEDRCALEIRDGAIWLDE